MMLFCDVSSCLHYLDCMKKRDIVYYNNTQSPISLPMSFKYRLNCLKQKGNRFYFNRNVHRYTMEIKDRYNEMIAEINRADGVFSIWYPYINQYGHIKFKNREFSSAIDAYKFLKKKHLLHKDVY